MFLYGSPLDQSSARGTEPEEEFKGSPFTMIYLDRLRNLVREKYAEMRVALSELMRQSEMEDISPRSTTGRNKRSVHNLPMGGVELMSVFSEDSHSERQERLNNLKREKM